jgi:hypothetical protein
MARTSANHDVAKARKLVVGEARLQRAVVTCVRTYTWIPNLNLPPYSRTIRRATRLLLRGARVSITFEELEARYLELCRGSLGETDDFAKVLEEDFEELRSAHEKGLPDNDPRSFRAQIRYLLEQLKPQRKKRSDYDWAECSKVAELHFPIIVRVASRDVAPKGIPVLPAPAQGATPRANITAILKEGRVPAVAHVEKCSGKCKSVREGKSVREERSGEGKRMRKVVTFDTVEACCS